MSNQPRHPRQGETMGQESTSTPEPHALLRSLFASFMALTPLVHDPDAQSTQPGEEALEAMTLTLDDVRRSTILSLSDVFSSTIPEIHEKLDAKFEEWYAQEIRAAQVAILNEAARLIHQHAQKTGHDDMWEVFAVGGAELLTDYAETLEATGALTEKLN